MRIAFHLALTVVLLSLVIPRASARTSPEDIVLYASDVTLLSGGWSVASSTTGAGGRVVTTSDQGWSVPEAPLASPTHYFHVSFDAPAGTTYQVWLRLRAASNSKWNDSVWVQFDDAVTATGAPLWRIGTTSGLLVNLEDCVGCGVSGWGWQDNASWTGQVARVRFAATGRHTMRVQVREDGVAIDQIVLSPATWFNAPPGAVRDDRTIVPKPSTAPTVTLVRHPYLQQVTDSSAIVVWATRESGAADVQYDLGGVTRIVSAHSRLVPATTTGMGFDYYQHEALIPSLQAATTYGYTPRLSGVPVSEGDRLTTAPLVGTGTARFIAFGDSGVGSVEQRTLAARMTADTFDFALHTGDVVYGTETGVGAGGYAQLHKWFFDIYRDWLRRRPMFPSIGNHDEEANRAAPYRDVFVLPSHGASATYPDHARRFYSFDYGPAHVVVLDTERAFQSAARREAQLEWLVNDLAATAQPWKIAVFHRSPYSAGGEHGSDLSVRAAFAPVFDRYGVQLVLSGHEHDYERTIPIRETADGSPVVYVVTGGGGGPVYPSGRAWWTATSRSAFHYVRGAVASCTLSLEAVGLDGAVFDAAMIDRCGAPPPPTPLTQPYGGTPALLPGTIEAEAFDEGPSGHAYVDSTPGNTGNALRRTDVDIQPTSDAGGGYNVGWTTAGEWLAYSVDVRAAGTFTLDVRVAASGRGGTFHVEADGVDISGPLTIPDTGGWQRWTTLSRTAVALKQGRQTLRLVLDANGPGGVFGNINFLRVRADGAGPFHGTPVSVPGLVEAEDFDDGGPNVGYRDTSAGNSGGRYRATDVDIEATTDAGGGFNVGWVAPGEWLAYSVDVFSSGLYVIEARVAANGQGGTFHVKVDGADVTGPLTIPNTGGWQKWTTVRTAGVALTAGRRTLRVVFDTAGPGGVVGNLNYLRLTSQ